MPCNAAAALLLLSSAASAHAARTVAGGRHGGFLSLRSDLQPEAVALTLARVEQDWREQAASFARCNTTGAAAGAADCESTSGRFRTSCATVVNAVLKASSGRPGIVREYLNEVCAQRSLEGWRSEACQGLASAVLSVMSPNAYANREDIDVALPCQSFWQSFASKEAVRFEKEQAEEQAEEKRRAEAAEKLRQAAQEAAVAKVEAQRREEVQAAAEKVAQAKRDAEEAAKQAVQQRMAKAAKAIEDLSAQAKDQVDQASQDMAKAQATIDESKPRPPPAVAAAGNASVVSVAASAGNSSSMAPSRQQPPAAQVAAPAHNATEAAATPAGTEAPTVA